MSNNIRVKNFQLSDSMRVYAERKLFSQIEKLFRGDVATVNIDLDIELGTRHHKKGDIWHASLGVTGPRISLWLESDASGAQSAIDMLENELKRELKKYKERMESVAKRKTREIKQAMRLDKGARAFRGGRNRNEGI